MFILRQGLDKNKFLPGVAVEAGAVCACIQNEGRWIKGQVHVQGGVDKITSLSWVVRSFLVVPTGGRVPALLHPPTGGGGSCRCDLGSVGGLQVQVSVEEVL